MDNLSDNALMIKVKADDLDHLGLLYERYKRPIFGFFYHQHGDKMLAEDLIQSVFIRVMKYRKSFSENRQFKSWLFQIARNVSHDHFKKTKGYQEELKDEHMILPVTNDTSREKEEQLTLMERALTLLDTEKREILTLSKLKALKYKEIGELYDCTESAVKVKVFRAMKALKKQYIELELLEQ